MFTIRKIIFSLLIFTISIFANNNTSQKHILVLHSYNKSMSWVKNIDKAINDTIKPNKNNYVLHVEYMDTKRIFTIEYINNLKTLYKNKYKNIKFDLILSSDNNAFNFLRTNRDKLFGNVPVSFCGVNFFKDSDLEGLKNYTGAVEMFDAKATIDMALKLNPKAKNIFVINDYLTTGKAWTKTIKEQLKDINKNIIYSNNSSIEDLQKRLQVLDKNTIVLLGVYFKDKHGKYFTYEKIGKLISQSSTVPIFCLLEFNLGNGIVGGSVIGGYYQGLAMSKIANKILHGVSVSDIPIRKDGATKLIFDYNALDKYNIDIELLPKNAIILNNPVSFYNDHKIVILFSIFIIFILLIIITILLINIRKRKIAEKSLLESKQEIDDINSKLENKVKTRTKQLQSSVDKFEQLFNSTMEAIVIIEDGKIKDLNQVTLDLFGYSFQDELIGINPQELTAKESQTKLKEQLAKDNDKPYEIKLIKKDGSLFDALIHGTNLTGQNLRLSCILDISNIKKQEQIIYQQAKLVSMGEMIGNIAHQWRQPLSIISTVSTGMIMKQEFGSLKEAELLKNCNTINENAQYLSKTIDDFKNFIKGDRTKKVYNLKNIINKFLHLIEGVSKNNNINIVLDLEENIEINGYENELIQCFINIFNNSKDALLANKIKNKLLFISTMEQDNNIIIKIKDNAKGIPVDILNKIFDPYFTTKHKSQGTGLGLNMTYNLITEGMNGKIIAQNMNYLYNDIEYIGAEFTILLSVK